MPALDNLTGSLDFGFSGDYGVLNYHFQNGRILDNASRFIGVYDVNQVVSLSGVVTPKTFDVYVNGQARAFGLPRDSGALNAILVRPEGVSVDFDLFVNGEVPNYAFSNPVPFQTGVTVPITGYIQNLSNQPFTVYSGQYLGIDPSFSLLSVQTGLIPNSGQIVFQALGENAAGLFNLPFSLYTDFGVVTGSFAASGESTIPTSYYVYLNGPTTISNVRASNLFTCQFGDPNGGLAIIPSLSYMSGSGTYSGLLNMTGSYTGQVTGLINNTGNLEYLFSGLCSGLNTQGEMIYAPLVLPLSQFFTATGNYLVEYSVPATGMVADIGYTGLATGVLSGTYTTGINGSLEVIFNPTGTPSSYTLAPTGYQQATGFLSFSSPSEGDVIYIGNSCPLAYPYDFSSVSGLANLLNSNSSYNVRASVSGSTLELVSLLSGNSGNALPLSVDSCNVGNYVFSSNTLLGGTDIYGTNLAVVGQFTGAYDQVIFATGNFSQHYTGVVTGQASGVSYTKTLNNTWTLLTGSSSILSSMSPVSSNISGINKAFYLALVYSNPVDQNTDVVLLSISGVNKPAYTSLTISGVPS